MKRLIMIHIALLLCLSVTHICFAQNYAAPKSDAERSVKIQPVSVATENTRTEREVLVRPVEPVAPVGASSYATDDTRASMGSYGAGHLAAPQQKSFWQKTKDGLVTASKYTWSGIKKGAHWTWTGTKKGAYYMKEGFISVAEKTGMIKDTELSAHSDIMNLANKTLLESKTKREIREDRLRRAGGIRVDPDLVGQ